MLRHQKVRQCGKEEASVERQRKGCVKFQIQKQLFESIIIRKNFQAEKVTKINIFPQAVTLAGTALKTNNDAARSAKAAEAGAGVAAASGTASPEESGVTDQEATGQTAQAAQRYLL